MAPCEALYKRKCRLAIHWYETGEQKYLGPELMEQATKEIEKIQCLMKTSPIRQKCYADKRRKPIKVIIGEHMFLKVSSMWGIVWFGKKKKGQAKPLICRTIQDYCTNWSSGISTWSTRFDDRYAWCLQCFHATQVHPRSLSSFFSTRR